MSIKLNNNIYKRLCFFLALYILNLSVDSPDTHNFSATDSLQINDQESILEIVIEKVLKFDDVVLEYDDDDTETSFKKQKNSIDFYISQLKHLVIAEGNNYSNNNFSSLIHKLKYIYYKIPSPPPDGLI